MWSLPRDCSSEVLHLIVGDIPVFDDICKRAMKFIWSCFNSSSLLVRFVVNYGINFARMNSPIGRNALFCSLRYKVSMESVCITRFSPKIFSDFFASRLSYDTVAKARSAYELIMLRENVLTVPGLTVCTSDLSSMLNDLLAG